MKAGREAAFIARHKKAKVAYLRAKEKALEKAVKAKEDKAKAELQKKLDAIPKTFDSEECGQGKHWGRAKEIKARRDCLERLKMRSPPLQLEDEVRWAKVAQEYAIRIGKAHEKAVGVIFLGKVNDVLIGLGEHLVGPKKHKESGGDPKAFLKFFKHMEGFMPKKSKTVTL